MHPKFYEKDVSPTSIAELEFIRSPFYDLAKIYHLKEGESVQTLLTQVNQKLEMLEPLVQITQGPGQTKENVAFKRYADRVADPNVQGIFQFPRG